MGHHINDKGEFQSDKFPQLPPDYVAINMKHEHNWPVLAALAVTYRDKKPDFAEDILTRLDSLHRAKKKDITFILNGRPITNPHPIRVSHEELCALAEQPFDSSITYESGVRAGLLKPSGFLKIEDGMVLHVTGATPVREPGDA